MNDPRQPIEDEGGPAFPSTENGPGGETDHIWHGMTLRDYFAGQALQGALAGYWANDSLGGLRPQDFAIEAYGLADAMLEERERERGT